MRDAPCPCLAPAGLPTLAAAAVDVVAAGMSAWGADAPDTPARAPVLRCPWRAPRSLRDGWVVAVACVAPRLAAGVDGAEAAIGPVGVALGEAVTAGALVRAGWGAVVGEVEAPPWVADVALLPSALCVALASVWPEEVAEPEPFDPLLASLRRARWRDSRGPSSRAFSSWGRSARGRSLRGCSSRGRSSRWRPAPRCSCAGARASRRPGFCRPAPPALGCVAPAPCGWRPAPCDSGPAPWDPCSATRWACPGFGVRLAGAPATGWARSGLARAGALPSIAMQARSAAGSRCRRGVACGRCPRGSLTIAESAPINSSGPRVPACERGPPRASRRSRTLHRARRTRRSSAPARSRRRSRSAYGDRGAG